MPKQSWGCRNCVARRVRCDETRPVCLKCIKQNLDCAGPRDRECPLFVNHTAWTHALSKKSNTRDKQCGKGNGTSAGSDSSKSSRSTKYLKKPDARIRILRPEEASSSPCSNLGWSKYAVDVHICFLRNYWYGDDATWIDACLKHPGDHPTATLALQSLASAFTVADTVTTPS